MLTASRPSAHIKKDPLGRYYTVQDISGFLIQQMAHCAPKSVIDLGTGGGALSIAARKQWHGAELLTVDVDEQVRENLIKAELSNHLGSHIHFHADVLTADLPKLLGVELGTIDAAVCNPPFIRPKWRNDFANILEDAGLTGIPAISQASADLLFLAQNLRMVRNKGIIGLIVPDGLISSQRYIEVRKTLLKQHQINSVIRLPRNAFIGTDAQAFILILTKGERNTNEIRLHDLSSGGQLSSPLIIDADKAHVRLDYGFNNIARSGIKKKKSILLNDLIISLSRGSLSRSEADKLGLPIFHTTDFQVQTESVHIDFPKNVSRPKTNKHTSYLVAGPGDILIGRVGRNLHEKICIVNRGTAILSDCVYRLRVAPNDREVVLAALTSKFGRTWLSAMAYGVSAKQLTKHDLLQFPV